MVRQQVRSPNSISVTAMAIALAFGIVTAIVPTAVVAQTTFQVDASTCPGPGTGTVADPFCMIQDAIVASVNGDEIIVAPGTYNELINFLGKGITLRSSGDREATIIDGAGLNDSVVKCVSGEGSDTVLDGFTITGGTGNLESPRFPNEFVGGGMLNVGSSPAITDCVFLSNAAARGGGGMYNEQGNPTVTRCLFELNNSGDGGGMMNTSSSPTVTDCVFLSNQAGAGGGITNFKTSNPTIVSCMFLRNSAILGQGGGIQNATVSNPLIINCLFARNSATIGGGGLANTDSTHSTVVNSTFTLNTSILGGGVWTRNLGRATLVNCILWANSSQIEGSSVSASFSDIEGGYAGPGNINVDPLFVDGTPETENDNLRLSVNSPCIDAGNNTFVLEPTDLDGNARIANGTVDMGAYEFPGPFIPAVSIWGMIAMMLLTLTAGTLVLSQRRIPHPAEQIGRRKERKNNG